MKTDRNGCSTCPSAAERYEEYYSSLAGGTRVQYDYRTPDGRLFSCVAKSVGACRAMRDEWLQGQRETGR